MWATLEVPIGVAVLGQEVGGVAKTVEPVLDGETAWKFAWQLMVVPTMCGLWLVERIGAVEESWE